jgi:hypothetical protein
MIRKFRQGGNPARRNARCSNRDTQGCVIPIAKAIRSIRQP